MSGQGQNLIGQIQEQVQQTAQDFYGESLGAIKSQLANHRSELQEIIQMLPESQEQEGGRAKLEQLLSSYEELEGPRYCLVQAQTVLMLDNPCRIGLSRYREKLRGP